MDSILEKSLKYLSDERNITNTKTIRIVDPSCSFDECRCCYYKRVCIRTTHKIPLDLNTGRCKDIIVNYYKIVNGVIKVNVLFRSYKFEGLASEQMFAEDFEFVIKRGELHVNKFSLTDLDDWEGYFHKS